jgi:hypothetical protein
MIAEVMPMPLGEIIELVLGRIPAAGRNRVQERLPQMRAVALDEGDVGKFALAQAIAETGDELEAGRSAAADNDSMVIARRRHRIRNASRRASARSKGEPRSPVNIAAVDLACVARCGEEPQ